MGADSVPDPPDRVDYWAPAGRTGFAQVTLGRQGRLVVPAEIRNALGLDAGQTLSLQVRDGGLFLITPEAAGRRLVGSIPRVPGRKSMAEELLEDRRVEAAREDFDRHEKSSGEAAEQ